MTQPPLEMVKIAVLYARESPCAKSKRGVVAWIDSGDTRDVVVGFNGPPEGFTCNGSLACKASCGQRAMHAEARALAAMANYLGAERAERASATGRVGRDAPPTWQRVHILHVKIGPDGELVAGGGPSCVACSRAIADVGLAAMWLYELMRGLDELKRAGVKPNRIMVYMLIGHEIGETHEERDYRRIKLREFGCRPYPMPGTACFGFVPAPPPSDRAPRPDDVCTSCNHRRDAHEADGRACKSFWKWNADKTCGCQRFTMCPRGTVDRTPCGTCQHPRGDHYANGCAVSSREGRCACSRFDGQSAYLNSPTPLTRPWEKRTP